MRPWLLPGLLILIPGVLGPHPMAPRSLPKHIVSGYDTALMRFEPNVGQAPSPVQYLARGNGYGVALTESGTLLKLPNAGAASLRVSLVGARAHPMLRPERPQQSISNYFVGNDPAKWHRRVPNYAAVRYERVYPGIDWVVYGNPQHLEYDFVVLPHADAGQIGVSVAGADGIAIDASGDLLIKVGDTTLRQLKPVVYQTDGHGVRHGVDAHYLLDRQSFAFELGTYDRSRPLIIDPELVYSTYLGGSQGYGGASAAAVDAAGDLYLAGATTSTDFPLASAIQTTRGAPQQAVFVAKFNPSGTVLLYSTYLGGMGTRVSIGDAATALAVDGAGNAYVTGYASTPDFPTVNPYQAVNAAAGPAGETNAFVTKIDPTGAALVYSTYLGGSDPGGCETSFSTGSGIAVDGAGSAYVVGQTRSANFPTVSAYQSTTQVQETTNGASGPQTTPDGTPCAAQISPVITKLNPSGDGLVYSTYLGPTGDENAATAVAVDSSGSAYVVGTTVSSGFPTVAAFQPAAHSQGFAITGFVTKFSPDGKTLVYSTYLGGSKTDLPAAVAVDTSGEAYVTGSTSSQDFPVANPLQGQNNSALAQGGTNAFVTKFAASGSALIFSTYLGGSNSDFADSIALDSDGNVYVAGSAHSDDFPTANALQTTNKGVAHSVTNAFISVMNTNGGTLDFSTYLGGSGGDSARGIAVDSARNIYVAGGTSSSDFPTMAPFQSTKAATASSVAFASKIAGVQLSGVATGGSQKGGGGKIGWDFIGVFAAALAIRRQRTGSVRGATPARAQS